MIGVGDSHDVKTEKVKELIMCRKGAIRVARPYSVHATPPSTTSPPPTAAAAAITSTSKAILRVPYGVVVQLLRSPHPLRPLQRAMHCYCKVPRTRKKQASQSFRHFLPNSFRLLLCAETTSLVFGI
jgi:hypothetical protein